MFLIYEGVFDVSKDHQTIAELTVPDSFGEIGLLLQKPRTASVRSRHAGMILPIPRSLVMSILKDHFQFGLSMEAVASHRLGVQ